jgi:hypothetical protein
MATKEELYQACNNLDIIPRYSGNFLLHSFIYYSNYWLFDEQNQAEKWELKTWLTSCLSYINRLG